MRHILLVQVNLLQQRGKELSRFEAGGADHVAQVFPEELALVDDLAAAHVEQVHRQHLVFVVIAEDVGIVALNGGDALLLVQQLDGRDEIAILGRQFVLLALGCGRHALLQRARQIGAAAFEKHPHVVNGFGVALGRGQSFHARSQAAPDVVLQARPRIVAVQVELARGNQKVPVDEIDDPIGQAGREVRPEVERAVAAQAARRIDPRIALADRQLDVRVGLVVAQKDVVARLLLLDQVVLKRQRFLLVVHDDVVEVDGLAQQRSGLGIVGRALQKIGAHAGAQAVGLAHVDDLAVGVLVQIHAGRGRQSPNFLVKVHSVGAGLRVAAYTW